MGQVKKYWMEQQELQPMYDWIEENYGDDAGEEGSEEWDEAVLAFEEYCENQIMIEDEEYRQLELEWYIYSESPVGIFNQQIRSIKELLNVRASYNAEFSLLVMLYGHTVASVESYLASTFIHKVINSEELIRRLVETDPKFSKMKFTMKEIYEKQQNLKLTVVEYLKDLIFHDLRKVKPMFRDVLECDFGEITWLFEAVHIRHHCVHRAGLDKDGYRIDISKESIKSIIDQSSKLVRQIESTLLPESNFDAI